MPGYDKSPGVPEWDELGIPEKDDAEPEDAGAQHEESDASDN